MQGATLAPPLVVATVGNPNVGKSSLINCLAGSSLEVGNWSGTTVQKLSAQFEHAGTAVTLVDLPGAYNLSATNTEERLTRQELLENPPDLVLNVVDSANLERNLYLTLELLELRLPVVVVLNLVDEAEQRGLKLRPESLSKALGVPVLVTHARAGTGRAEVLNALAEPPPVVEPDIDYPEVLENALNSMASDEPETSRWILLERLFEEDSNHPERRKLVEAGHDPFLLALDSRYEKARSLAEEVTEKVTPSAKRDWLDRMLLHPLTGIPLFLGALLLTFRFTFLFSDPWIEFFGAVQEVLAGWVGAMGLPEIARSFLADGLIGGLGTVVAFAPVLFFLYLGMSFLESSGFLTRIAVLADRVARSVGLSGRALIPLLLGFGCNVPAIYATRGLESFSERLRTAMAIPFMACSARLAVFALFASVFFPKNGALVVFGLYLLGLTVGLVTAAVLRRHTNDDTQTSGVMELPPYRLPTLGLLFRQAGHRTMDFIKGAGGMITITVLVIWLMLNIPGGGMENSLYAKFSALMSHVFAPLGVTDWRLIGALIPGFIAKEVVIGTLGISFLGAEPGAVMGLGEGLAQLGSSFGQALIATLNAVPGMFGVPEFIPTEVDAPSGLPAKLAGAVGSAGALGYLVFLLLYTPCVATIAAIRDEFGKKWAYFTVFYQLAVAYVGGVIVYLLARWLF